jgi:hypothetical protein
MPPVDLDAFKVRAEQRARTRRLLAGGSKEKPTSRGRFMRVQAERALGAAARDEIDRREQRATDPVEMARLYLQRRGYVVVRADVVDGPTDCWEVRGRGWLTDAELIALAQRQGFNLPTNEEGNADV